MIDWRDIPVADLPDRISDEQRDRLFLTDRQLQVLQCLAKGMTAKQAAIALHLSPRTIEIHMRDIRERTGLNTVRTLIFADRLFRQGLR